MRTWYCHSSLMLSLRYDVALSDLRARLAITQIARGQPRRQEAARAGQASQVVIAPVAPTALLVDHLESDQLRGLDVVLVQAGLPPQLERLGDRLDDGARRSGVPM